MIDCKIFNFTMVLFSMNTKIQNMFHIDLCRHIKVFAISLFKLKVVYFQYWSYLIRSFVQVYFDE
jgi:hypothetical protein